MSTDLNISRPTSRVLRPPGGGSSNIFGNDEPVAPKPVARNPAPAPAPVPAAAAPQRAAPAPQQAAPQPAPVSSRRQPPGGQSSIVFG